jgi:hypothetical protein
VHRSATFTTNGGTERKQPLVGGGRRRPRALAAGEIGLTRSTSPGQLAAIGGFAVRSARRRTTARVTIVIGTTNRSITFE